MVKNVSNAMKQVGLDKNTSNLIKKFMVSQIACVSESNTTLTITEGENQDPNERQEEV